MTRGECDFETMPRKPVNAVESLREAALATFCIVNGRGVMIEADADRDLGGEDLVQRNKLVSLQLHRFHSIREHQCIEAARQRSAKHCDDVTIHERLAAGEADFARLQAKHCDLVEISFDLC